jgi:hypothetical protein
MNKKKSPKLLSLEKVEKMPTKERQKYISNLSASDSAKLSAQAIIRNLNDPRNHNRSI